MSMSRFVSFRYGFTFSGSLMNVRCLLPMSFYSSISVPCVCGVYAINDVL